MRKFVLTIVCFFSADLIFSQVPNCYLGTKAIDFEAENLRARLGTRGGLFWDGIGIPQFNWPKSSPGTVSKHLVFAAGFWSGAIDSSTGQLVVATHTYGGDHVNFWPGPLIQGTIPIIQAGVCKFWDQHFALKKISLDSHLTALQSHPIPLLVSQIPSEVRRWPGKGNDFLKAEATLGGLVDESSLDEDLAPFIDVNGNGIYDPANGDYPDMGNRMAMVWWVMNDAGNTKNFNHNTSLVPAGNLEFQVTASSFPSNPNANYLANSIFMDLKVINKGVKTLKDFYQGFWIDFDIGNANDDYIQCDPLRNLGIGFNADSLDEGFRGYGPNPPALAFKILNSPGPFAENDGVDNDRNGLIDEQGEIKIMTGFGTYNNTSDLKYGNPEKANDFYQYLRSKWLDGSDNSYDGLSGYLPVTASRPKTDFLFPGKSDSIGLAVGGTLLNPIPMPEWSEFTAQNPPGDRRALMHSGPFVLRPGKSFVFSFCNLIGFGGSNLENLEMLNDISDSLDNYLPIILSTEPVSSEPLNNELKLFPNPTSGLLTIQSSEPIETICILDQLGKIIWLKKANNQNFTIDISGLKPGFYFLISDSQGGRMVKKFVIE